MNTPRFRFTVMPALLALFVGLQHLRPLNIVRVDARGLGHERLAPWRARAASLRATLRALTARPWFRPAMVGMAVLALMAVDWRAVFAAPLALGTSLSENQHAAAFLLTEAEGGSRSRENIIVLSGQNLKAGHVIGRRLVTPTVAAAVADAGNTGNGTVTGQADGTNLGAQRGDYRLICVEPGTNVGTFAVYDPSGRLVGHAVVAVAFDNQIKFTINDGATDFVPGDAFTINVSAGTYKYLEYDPTNTDGSQRVAGVLYDAVDASAADMNGAAIARDAEVRSADLVWFDGATTAQQNVGLDGLAALGIIPRS